MGPGDAGPPPWASSSSPQGEMQPIAPSAVVSRYFSVGHQACFAVQRSFDMLELLHPPRSAEN